MVHSDDSGTEVCTIVQGCLPEICCNEDPPIPLTWQKTPLFKLLLYSVHTTQQCNTQYGYHFFENVVFKFNFHLSANSKYLSVLALNIREGSIVMICNMY